MNSEKVVIIIPTYNEALVIEQTIISVFQAVESIENKDVHLLIFDSQSTDHTVMIVQKLQQNYPGLHLKIEPKKTGLGSAYLQAMQYALIALKADIVGEFDADLSHQPKYLAPMLQKLVNYDVVVGSRYIVGGSIPAHWQLHRKLLSILGNQLARYVLTRKYKDLTSGFRLSRRQALLAVLPTSFISNHYAYKLELMWLLHKNKSTISEYPIVFVDRQLGISKLPKNCIIDALFVLFTLRLKETKRYLKMSMVGISGLAVQCLTFNMVRLHFSLLNAAQLAVAAAMINNFVLNNHFTFKSYTPRRYVEKIKLALFFISYSLVMINLQSYWLKFASQYLGASPIKENVIMILGAVLASMVNYAAYSRLIWHKTA